MDKLTKTFVIAASSVVVLAGGVYLKQSVIDPMLSHLGCVNDVVERSKRSESSSKDSSRLFWNKMCTNYGNDPDKVWDEWGI